MNRCALLGGPKAVDQPLPAWPIWDESDRHAITSVLDSGKWWMYAYGDAELGAEETAAESRSQVEQFEAEFAQMHHVRHAIAVSSGAMALEICMRAIDLKPGDEVITTPYTFFATSMCILNHMALPVYVDIDPNTYNIDPKRIEEAITERTRAILPVHFAGEPCDMDAIQSIAKKHNLIVIEDSAQAQGVDFADGQSAGGVGHAGIFSFQASKCLAAGEGGIITTQDDDMADAAWSLRHYGRTRDGAWHEHYRLGWNARMTEFAAALLRTQLKRLPSQNETRMANVARFYEGIADIDGLDPIHLNPNAVTHNHYLVILRYNAAAWNGLPRDRFIAALNAEGVPVSAGYSFPNYANPVFASLDFSSPQSPFTIGGRPSIDYRAFAERCPAAERACRHESLWLMHSVFLGSADLVDQMIDAIRKIRSQMESL